MVLPFSDKSKHMTNFSEPSPLTFNATHCKMKGATLDKGTMGEREDINLKHWNLSQKKNTQLAEQEILQSLPDL